MVGPVLDMFVFNLCSRLVHFPQGALTGLRRKCPCCGVDHVHFKAFAACVEDGRLHADVEGQPANPETVDLVSPQFVGQPRAVER